MPTGEKGKSYKENMEYHHGTSWKVKLRVAVDKAIWTSINYEEFLQKMQLAGYEVRQDLLPAKREPLSLSQEINKIALATHSFSSKSSHGFNPFSPR